MPAPAERFARAVARHEDRAVAGALTAWKQARPALLDAIATAGDPALSLQAVLSATGRDVDAGLRGIAPLLAGAAGALVLAQTGLGLSLTLALGSGAWQAAALGLFLAELAQLQAQRAAQDAVIARLITGRDGRASAYQLGENALQLHTRRAVWSAANGAVLTGAGQATRVSGVRYQKQVHAAIDKRTTDCCRRANGQIQELDAPFVLTGTPRYADRLMSPPFHGYCRTAISLYTPAMERISRSPAPRRET